MVLGAAIVVVLVADLFFGERTKWATSSLAGIGLLATLVPIVTLAIDGSDRVMFGGALVVDDFSLVLSGLFVLAGYVVVLLSSNELAEGDYYEGEYFVLLLASLLGMVLMTSARDLITIFVALEVLSIPAYMLAAWKKRSSLSNEAGVKYYLLGVFASAVMLYGMSLVFGVTGSTLLTEIGEVVGGSANSEPIVTLGIVFVIIGFGFKVSAVPFHTWAPDTYQGAPTPVAAFLSVASKAAGFVALLELILIGFYGRSDVWEPLLWILAALTMTFANLVALRQTNIVRMLAYSSISQGGFILAAMFSLGASPESARSGLTAVVTYLLIYGATGLGAFAVVIAVARKTRSGEISSYGGLFSYAPGLATLMTVFLFSLAGVPPLAGWVAKFTMFRALVDAGGGWAITLAVLAGLNSVVALFYYANVARQMWMSPVPDDDRTPVRVPASLGFALLLTGGVTLVVGVFPQLLARFGDIASFALGG
ncbi:MAG: NADH-quinone oxidoreductase subunit N [Acidimicrobiales bacterium]|nr:NADH-quinone oxidoreductase subunit N [Acidimicrobiales bacterium]